MNAIVTQLRAPINSGLTRWRTYGGLNKYMGTAAELGRNLVSKHYYRFSPSVKMSRLTRDGTAEPILRDLRRKLRQGNIQFPWSADHEQNWQPYPVDPYFYMCDQIYILLLNIFLGSQLIAMLHGCIYLTLLFHLIVVSLSPFCVFLSLCVAFVFLPCPPAWVVFRRS